LKRKKEILIHIIFWFVYIANSIITYPQEYIKKVGFWNIALKQATAAMPFIFLFYINYSYLIPKYLSNKKYWVYGITCIFLGAVTLLLYIFHAFFLDWYLNIGNYFLNDRIQYLPYHSLQVFFYLLISTGAKFTSDWFNNQKLKEELEKERITSELAQLKYQINPHFLFNTFNNIYSLVNKKSDAAPEAILKLSEIMRYILNENNSEKVQLEKEINYLQSFIELQKLRLKNPGIVELIINGNLKSFEIAPLLLLPFVENAFKHGDISSEKALIEISINIENSCLEFITRNLMANNKTDKTQGIGLNNVKRRLVLLYPCKHILNIKQDNGIFDVYLKIILK
jgi:two-component system, LytTR family, sensor kinase